jgi:hypothetical protein
MTERAAGDRHASAVREESMTDIPALIDMLAEKYEARSRTTRHFGCPTRTALAFLRVASIQLVARKPRRTA